MTNNNSEKPNTQNECPVNSWNEWDPLEEVIVGRVEGSAYPKARPEVLASIPSDLGKMLKIFGGWSVPKFLQTDAQKELDEFISILEGEGIKVVRPDIVKFGRRCKTPVWSAVGNACACPRDTLMVLGKKIIEAPCSFRSRYFENDAYKSLFMEETEFGMTFGGGLLLRFMNNLGLKVDYAFKPVGILGNTHSYTLGLIF